MFHKIFFINAILRILLSASAEKMYSGPGTWLGINICYGLAVTLGVYVSGRVSGGHINPAVSMAEAVRGTLAWKDLPFYIISQVLFL